jgi:hypothetical protein
MKRGGRDIVQSVYNNNALLSDIYGGRTVECRSGDKRFYTRSFTHKNTLLGRFLLLEFVWDCTPSAHRGSTTGLCSLCRRQHADTLSHGFPRYTPPLMSVCVFKQRSHVIYIHIVQRSLILNFIIPTYVWRYYLFLALDQITPETVCSSPIPLSRQMPFSPTQARLPSSHDLPA